MSVSDVNPSAKLATSAGSRLPLGASVQEGGVNFAVFSPRATRVWLRLYRGASDVKPVAEVELEAATHRTYGFWHVFVAGARAGWFYTWRAEISKRLISEKGFSFIAVEGDWPDCYAVNRYVKSIDGESAEEVLHAFSRWPTDVCHAGCARV